MQTPNVSSAKQQITRETPKIIWFGRL